MGLMPPSGLPRVVISGIGVVSPFGVGRDRFWQHVSRGCSGTRAITQFDVSTYPCQVAAWVPPVSMADALELEAMTTMTGARTRNVIHARRCSASWRRVRRGVMPACAQANPVPAC